jgi:excisionase family DNA binding protein
VRKGWDEYPDFLTVREAAEIARVDKDTMYTEVHVPGFPAVRFGRTIRIPKDAFRKYCDRQEVSA